MYIAINCEDFFNNGEFTVWEKKKDCPAEQNIIRVTKPCFLEVKFGYHEKIGVFAKRVTKIKEKNIDMMRWQASFCNAPDDFTSQYEEIGDGYRFATYDNLGLPVLCRVIHITNEHLKSATQNIA